MGKFYVRIITIILNLYIAVQLYTAYKGNYDYNYDLILSCPIWSAILLVIIGNKYKNYFCSYMRLLQYNLLIIVLINFIDAKFNVFDKALEQLIVLSIIWLILTSVSLVLAIKHFIQWNIQKKKKERLDSCR